MNTKTAVRVRPTRGKKVFQNENFMYESNIDLTKNDNKANLIAVH